MIPIILGLYYNKKGVVRSSDRFGVSIEIKKKEEDLKGFYRHVLLYIIAGIALTSISIIAVFVFYVY